MKKKPVAGKGDASKPTMVQTALWLPRDLHERLKSLGGERGLGEEIRRRLEASFEVERDDQTRALTVPLAEVVEQVGEYLGDWRKDAFAFEVLRSAVNFIIEQLKPPGDPVPHFNTDSLFDLLYSTTDTPEQTGKKIAAQVLYSLAKKAKAS